MSSHTWAHTPPRTSRRWFSRLSVTISY